MDLIWNDTGLNLTARYRSKREQQGKMKDKVELRWFSVCPGLLSTLFYFSRLSFVYLSIRNRSSVGIWKYISPDLDSSSVTSLESFPLTKRNCEIVGHFHFVKHKNTRLNWEQAWFSWRLLWTAHTMVYSGWDQVMERDFSVRLSSSVLTSFDSCHAPNERQGRIKISDVCLASLGIAYSQEVYSLCAFRCQHFRDYFCFSSLFSLLWTICHVFRSFLLYIPYHGVHFSQATRKASSPRSFFCSCLDQLPSVWFLFSWSFQVIPKG